MHNDLHAVRDELIRAGYEPGWLQVVNHARHGWCLAIRRSPRRYWYLVPQEEMWTLVYTWGAPAIAWREQGPGWVVSLLRSYLDLRPGPPSSGGLRVVQ